MVPCTCYPFMDERPCLFRDLRVPWISLGPANNVGHPFVVEVLLIDEAQTLSPERLEFVFSVELVRRYGRPVP